jgi:hypothetical protein
MAIFRECCWILLGKVKFLRKIAYPISLRYWEGVKSHSQWKCEVVEYQLRYSYYSSRVHSAKEINKSIHSISGRISSKIDLLKQTKWNERERERKNSKEDQFRYD